VRVASDTSQRDRVAPEALTRLRDGDLAELRASICRVPERPEFAPVTTLPTAEFRARVYGAPIGRRDAAG
jgi:hypothetical protein